MRVDIQSHPMRAAVAALLEAASLPSSDLTDAHMAHFFYSGARAAPVALIGFEVCGEDALLRSLVVAPGQRAAGLGSRMVEHVESEARSSGLRAIYLLTTTAETFFSKRGYVAADRGTAPAAIRATPEFSVMCPATSAFMFKPLHG